VLRFCFRVLENSDLGRGARTINVVLKTAIKKMSFMCGLVGVKRDDCGIKVEALILNQAEDMPKNCPSRIGRRHVLSSQLEFESKT